VSVASDALAVAVDALLGRPLAAAEPFAVAVSGGPDSLALLILAHSAFGERVRVLTVDHSLRADSADEAVAVADYAASLGVPHVTLPWTGPKPTANLQAAARDARYALMADWCAANGVAWLATAHHRDDAAETLLLRLARGSGVGGLGGIRLRRDLGHGVTLIRPLLGASKVDLAAIAAAAGWTVADDPSNRADRFDRTRARRTLAATPWLDPARLAASAAHLADAEAALNWTARQVWAAQAVVTADSVVVYATANLPHEVARRLLVRAVLTLAPSAVPRGSAVERVLLALASGWPATLAGVSIVLYGESTTPGWLFRLAPPRRKTAP
jgi:tRNA(Ile)-lysidine synthase